MDEVARFIESIIFKTNTHTQNIFSNAYLLLVRRVQMVLVDDSQVVKGRRVTVIQRHGSLVALREKEN